MTHPELTQTCISGLRKFAYIDVFDIITNLRRFVVGELKRRVDLRSLHTYSLHQSGYKPISRSD